MRTLLTNSGTGKIYASALAMRELGFKRVLFLVHRVTLAKQAKKSFEKVFGKKALACEKVRCGNKLLLHGTIHCGGSQKCPERR